MKQSAKSYTMEVLTAMTAGLLASKESHGYKRLFNGLYEDVLGQVYTVDLEQFSEATGEGDEAGVVNHVVLKMKPVSIMGKVS